MQVSGHRKGIVMPSLISYTPKSEVEWEEDLPGNPADRAPPYSATKQIEVDKYNREMEKYLQDRYEDHLKKVSENLPKSDQFSVFRLAKEAIENDKSKSDLDLNHELAKMIIDHINLKETRGDDVDAAGLYYFLRGYGTLFPAREEMNLNLDGVGRRGQKIFLKKHGKKAKILFQYYNELSKKCGYAP